MIRVLALDHGTRTGWACGNSDRRPALGNRLNPHSGGEANLEPMWEAHHKWLTGVIRDFGPEIVVWEHPLLAEHTSLASLEVTCGLQAITGLTARQMRVPVRTVTVGEVKIALTGKGNADKAMMVEAAQALGFKIEHHDEADALGVWLHTVRVLDPLNATRFDPLFMER